MTSFLADVEVYYPTSPHAEKNIAGSDLKKGTTTIFDSINRVRSLLDASSTGITNHILEQIEASTPKVISKKDALFEIKQSSGLTWAQIAKIFNVSQRSIHLWLEGNPVASPNEEKLYRLLQIFRNLPYEVPFQNRTFLLCPQADGMILFDALCEGKEDVFRNIELKQQKRKWSPGSTLSKEEQEMRKPLPPAVLLNSFSGNIHKDIGTGRVAKATKRK